MAAQVELYNRLKLVRQAHGWSQAELAAAAGLSRAGISAIEGRRLVPSVAAALALAKSLNCTVEELFGEGRCLSPGARWAWQPAFWPCRYWGAEVAAQTWLFPVESTSHELHDGQVEDVNSLPVSVARASQTLVLASCDPAAALLTEVYRKQTGLRMVVFTRTSGEALALLEQRLIHVAGVHLASGDDSGGNATAVRQRLSDEVCLLRLADWEEGLALAPASNLRSAAAAARANLRWVGRAADAGARRCQNAILGSRAAPLHTVRDHRGVVEAIRGGWADAGVCLRIACEEGGLSFRPIAREPYDLCFRRDMAGDPRLTALVRVVRSREYQQLLGELPGYFPTHSGELEQV